MAKKFLFWSHERKGDYAKKIYIWGVMAALALSGCMDSNKGIEKTPIGSDQIMSDYSPQLKDCLRKCQVKYSNQAANDNDERRGCGCICHSKYGSMRRVSGYCGQNQDGLIQSSNADTLTDMRSKGGS